MIQKLVFVFLFISTICAAQEDSKPSYFGIKVGGNVATISGDISDNYSSRFGFHIGLAGELEINKKLQLAPEVLFSSIGANLKNDGSESELRLNYITLPISLRYYPIPSTYLEAGPQASFSVSAVQSKGASGRDEDITNSNQTDLGFNVGLGFKTSTRVLLGIRYYFGLSNLNEDQEFLNLKNQNRTFQFSIAYLFKN